MRSKGLSYGLVVLHIAECRASSSIYSFSDLDEGEL